MIIYFSGTEMILWFEKEAYLDVLTSTFINRNSYATFVGLGVLTVLALILRYLRRLLTNGSEARSQLRDFLETVMSSGWPLVVVLLLCFLALLLTESRMGLVAVLAGVTVLLLGWG
ncbi:MAG: hypothetical protein VBE63_28765, partial [Lamprobacter sp.]|uniref:hypothetical protein n=1 Tax=Lamprobacter sp. TaxID=3100796 RepID=UPI002B259951